MANKEYQLKYTGEQLEEKLDSIDSKANQTDLTAIDNRLSALENSVITVHSGADTPVNNMGENGDFYVVV